MINKKNQRFYIDIPVSIDKIFCDFDNHLIVFAVLLFYLSRVKCSNSFMVSIDIAALSSDPVSIEDPISSWLSLSVDVDYNLNFASFCQNILNRLISCIDEAKSNETPYRSVGSDKYMINKDRAGFRFVDYFTQDEETVDIDVLFIIPKNEFSIKLIITDNFLARNDASFEKNISERINVLIREILDFPNNPLYKLQFLTIDERKKILLDWNSTDRLYPHKTVFQLFEEQAKKTPDNIAVFINEHKLTYRELNEESNKLAHFIRQQYKRMKHKAISPNTTIGIYMERSLEMIVGILGILKSGGAYIPLDPEYPDERLKYIINDAKINLIMTQSKYYSRLSTLPEANNIDKNVNNFTTIEFDLSKNSNVFNQYPSTNPTNINKQTDLIYIIYTSGTTGKPKGVMIQHRGIVNRLWWMQKKFKLTFEDNILQKTSYGFDVSVWEIFWSLLFGAKLCLASPTEHPDPVYIKKIIAFHDITILHFVPSMLRMFLDNLNSTDIKRLSSLKKIFCSGEVLSAELVKEFRSQLGYVDLYNFYGPTEASIDVSYWHCSNDKYLNNSIVPIGKPIDNTSFYVLDTYLNPVPVGTIGELYVGGDGLAQGYLNLPELTAEKFIINPFTTKKAIKQRRNKKLYKTGDLVKWLSDGNLEYIGRNDFQVKIRGYRIELGEIENILLSYGGIKQSVVLAKERANQRNLVDNKYLIGYYVKDVEADTKNTKNFVDIWKSIYQTEYTALDINNFKYSIKGWNSSYTDEPIVKEDMLEFVDTTVERIKGYNPRVVLEIGSGSGLMLFNLIDGCNYYYATDFSQNVLKYTEDIVNKAGYKDRVLCLACAADQVPYGEITKVYDTVIINSVIQYFPNLDYLESIITKTIINMKGAGRIFIGDIRDYRLLSCFHYSVQKFKKENVTKSDIDYFARRDQELLVSPGYFLDLKLRNKRVSFVEIMPKLGKVGHEMNNYRYDVVVHIGADIQEDKYLRELDIRAIEFIKIFDIRNYIILNKDKILYIKYPNKRIWNDYLGYNDLVNNHLTVSLEDGNSILSLDEITLVAINNGYNVRYYLDVLDPLYLNIVFYFQGTDIKNIRIEYPEVKEVHEKLANNPLVTSKFLDNQIEKDLREYLLSKLPEYMVPTYLVRLDKMPLTINGKVDRLALPDPEFVNEDNYVAPRDGLEKQICQVWAMVLGLPIEKIGIKDNFFSLGGDSIMILQVMSKARDAGLYLTYRQLIDDPTIEKLALRAGVSRSEGQTLRNKQPVTGNAMLIPTQKWFFEQKFSNHNHFNQSFLFKVKKITKPDIFLKIFNVLIEHHDGFRLRYKNKNGLWKQYYTAKYRLKDIDIEEIDLSCCKKSNVSEIRVLIEQENTIQKEIGRLHSRLDIEQGPVLKVAIFSGHSDGNQRLLILIHHLIVDGVSWRILLDNFCRLYHQMEEKKPLTLPLKTDTYKDWGKVLEKYLKTKHVQSHWNYWLEASCSNQDILRKVDKNKFVLAKDISYYSIELTKTETIALLMNTSYAYNTRTEDILLSAFILSYGKWAKLDSLLLHLEGHGRENYVDKTDVSQTLGWFTSVFPVNFKIPQNGYSNIKSNYFEIAIKSIKEQLRKVPDKGLSYGVLRYLSDDVRVKQLIENDSAKITFNYLGQFTLDDSNPLSFAEKPSWINTGAYNKLHDLFFINAIIINNILYVDINYSRNHYRQNEIELLAKEIRDNLRLLIDNCVNSKTRKYTPSDFPLVELSQPEIDSLSMENNSGKTNKIESIYELTPVQKGLLFHFLHSPKSDQYCVQVKIKYMDLNNEIFKKSWVELIRRHHMLRVKFVWKGLKAPVQVSYEIAEPEWFEEDWSAYNYTKDRITSEIKCYLDKDRTRGFNFDKPCLMRFSLIKIRNDETVFVWSHHHILLDGWCLPILLKELDDVYKSINKNVRLSLPQAPKNDEYFRCLKNFDKNKAKRFWKSQLKGISKPTKLNINREALDIRMPIKDLREVIHYCSAELTDRLQCFAKGQHITINTLVLMAWVIVLSKYSGQDDIVVGVTVSGRTKEIPEIESMIGVFINTLPIRIVLKQRESIKSQMAHLQRKIQRSSQYSQLTLNEMQELTKIPKNIPLFYCLYAFENYSLVIKNSDKAIKKNREKYEKSIDEIEMHEKTNYPLSFIITHENKLRIKIAYDGKVFAEEIIKNLMGHILTAMIWIINNADGYLIDVDILTKDEKQKFLADLTSERMKFPHNSTIQQLFEKQVDRNPDSIIVIYRDNRLSYRHLNERSNQLANYIRERYKEIVGKALSKNTLIGICIDRNPNVLIGILGILKSGSAYVPLDPEYPDKRLEFIVHDTNIRIILTEKKFSSKVSSLIKGIKYCGNEIGFLVVCLDSDNHLCTIDRYARSNPININSSADLAYVIYTSGSTGNPNGVMVSHRNVNNYSTWFKKYSKINEREIVDCSSSFSFDFTVTTSISAIVNDLIVILCDNAIKKNPAKYIQHLRANNVNLVKLTPTFFNTIVHLLEEIHLPKLGKIILGGEPINASSIIKWLKKNPSCEIFNEYGPTETTVGVTQYLVTSATAPDNSFCVNIGKSLNNNSLYVLNDNFGPVPVMIPGELYIKGESVSLGYLNRPILTRRKFIDDLFAKKYGNKIEKFKMYKTGDLVRWLPDGNLEFLGRLDEQIKMTGFRIEPREIELLLSKHPLIKESVITLNGKKESNRLIAYLIVADKNKFNVSDKGWLASELENYLGEYLPGYMIPKRFIFLESFPQTINGKIDKLALDSIQDKAIRHISRILFPHNDIESKLINIWREVIKNDRISVNDNFFELGGSSISAITIVGLVEEELNTQLNLVDLFRYPTIRQLSQYLLHKADSRNIDLDDIKTRVVARKRKM